MGTVRFAKVVATCGRPEVHLLWSAPEKDDLLQNAMGADRVMMIHQESVGTKQDFGEIGYDAAVRGQILIFPKSLSAYSGKRVVGVQYDLLESAEPKEVAPKKEKKPVKAPAPKAKATPPEKPKSAPEPPPERPKLVPFIAPKEEKEEPPPAAAEAGKEKIASMQKEIRKAMEALEDGRHVAAYKILQRLSQD